MFKILSLMPLTLLFSLQAACASVYQADAIYDGASLKSVSLQNVVSQIPLGSIVIVSERHDSVEHHDKQVQFIKELLRQGHKVASGFEFFDYPQQNFLDSYSSGQMSEADFLQKTGWGNSDFGFYREQMRLGAQSGGAFALNAPRALTSQIAKVGWAGLTPGEKQWLPPDLARGRDSYFTRFAETMQGHVKPEQIERYFQAQSTWDETMAWQSVNLNSLYRDRTLVIIVGDFHAQYGGGLPDRIRERLRQAGSLSPMAPVQVFVVSQVLFEPSQLPATSDELSQQAAEVEPHPIYGPRAEFIWISQAK